MEYTEENVADALITGLADQEIKQGILGEPNQPLTIERAMAYVESKEIAKVSISQLDPNNLVNALRSKYKKLPRQGQPLPDVDDSKCYFCGKTGHGKYPALPTRSTECKAFGHKCSNCGKTNHSETVCKSKPPPRPLTENAVFNQVCNVSTHGANKHHTLRRLVAKLLPDDYIKLRLPQRSRPAVINIDGVADTGCQSCLVGAHILQKLGISKADLIPVTQRMQAANNSGIQILGAILLEFKLSGTEPCSKQMVYISRLFLSREACSELGMIPRGFPSTVVGATSSIVLPEKKKSGPTKQETKRPCNCPTRSQPPTRPIPLPVPATEANSGVLEQHLRTIFKASTFNTCCLQPLPMMAGPPLRLNIDPEATPVMAHKAASVPVHWEGKVKEHLDRDVCLGVIEKVPVGTPDTWCQRMMIVGESNGEPRRVIDFQPLNTMLLERLITPSPLTTKLETYPGR